MQEPTRPRQLGACVLPGSGGSAAPIPRLLLGPFQVSLAFTEHPPCARCQGPVPVRWGCRPNPKTDIATCGPGTLPTKTAHALRAARPTQACLRGLRCPCAKLASPSSLHFPRARSPTALGVAGAEVPDTARTVSARQQRLRPGPEPSASISPATLADRSHRNKSQGQSGKG